MQATEILRIRMSPPEAQRPLGLLESYYSLLEKVSGADFLIVCELQGSLDINGLRRAASALQNSVPALRTSVRWSDGPEFTITHEPLEVEVQRVPDEWCLEKCSEVLLSERHGGHPAPPMRIVLMESPGNSHLFLRIHHARFDARAGFGLLESLLNLYAEIDGGGALVFGSQSAETRVPERYRRKLKPKSEFADFKQSSEIYSCRFIHKEVDAEGLARLLSKCRANNTTLTGLLAALTVKVVSRHNQNYDKQVLTIPHNIASHLDSSSDADAPMCLGLFAGSFPSESDPWSLSCMVNQSLRSHLERYGYIGIIRFMYDQLFNPAASYEANVSGLQMNGDFASISNMGLLKFPARFGTTVVSNLHYMVSIGTLGSGLFVSTNTFEDRLNLNFTTSQKFLSDEDANSMVVDLMTMLKSI